MGNRKLSEDTSPDTVAEYFAGLRYTGYGKHKLNPHLYNLAPYHGTDSDRGMCDRDAAFGVRDMQRVPGLLDRSRNAALFGTLIWTVDDTGWIYELRVTNATQNEWHGYPMLPGDTFARQVWRRFADWAAQAGSPTDKLAAQACALLYNCRP